MEKGTVTKTKTSMTIDTELWNKYKQFCYDNGFKYSTRVALLMKRDMSVDESSLVLDETSTILEDTEDETSTIFNSKKDLYR